MNRQNENCDRKGINHVLRHQTATWACVALMAGSVVLSGCAQYTAINHPKPFTPSATGVGAERATVTCELGAPVVSTQRDDRLTETYKYSDGRSRNSAGSKTSRVIIYTVGDVFTVCLDQLLTWPLETYAFAGKDHVVTVEYAKGSDGLWWAKEVRDVESGKPKKQKDSGKPESASKARDSTKPVAGSQNQPVSESGTTN